MPKKSSLYASLEELAVSSAEQFLDLIRRTEAAVEPFIPLLERARELPVGHDEQTLADRSAIIDAAFERFVASVFANGELAAELLKATTRPVLSPAEKCLRTAIRTFFLEPQKAYTPAEIRTLFSDDAAEKAISMSQVPGTPEENVTLSWVQAAESVFACVPAASIEDALASDAGRLLPAGYKTRDVRLRLPIHVIHALEDEAHRFGLASIERVIENQYGSGDEIIEPW